jgi:hypothetical protein
MGSIIVVEILRVSIDHAVYCDVSLHYTSFSHVAFRYGNWVVAFIIESGNTSIRIER